MSPEAERIHKRILETIATEFFGSPLIDNLNRPNYVERMIVQILGDGWRHVGSAWAGWDIEGPAPKKIKVEVKQGAARQTWSDRESLLGKGASRFSKGVFDIAIRKSFFEEGAIRRVKYEGRPADVYVFAWHGETDKEKADHRDVEQWRFFVVKKSDLEDKIRIDQKRISLSKLRTITSAVTHKELPAALIHVQ